MNILCAICQDTLEPSNDIFITPCGHVFHFPCLIQWLEKAQNCPQCRQKVKRDRITRIYFNFSNTEAVKEDSFTLQQKVDSLMFQIKLKETEYNNCTSENATLKRQNSGLRDEVKKTESEINQKNGVIHALKEQIAYFKSACQDYDKVLAEKRALQSKIQTYENVKSLLCSTNEEVDEMLHRTSDISTLTTYVSIMKRELGTSMSKRKELRSTVKRLQHELQTIKMERNSFSEEHLKQVEQLEDELAMCKSENDILLKQLDELKLGKNDSNEPEEKESNRPSESSASRKRETDLTFDIDAVSPKKIKRGTEKLKSSYSAESKDDSDIVFISPTVKKTKENEENSPYLPTKSKSILALKERAPQRSGFSIGPKRPVLSFKKFVVKSPREKDTAIAFDGFGGHSKVETFPLPKTSPNKHKRSASESSKNKKIKLSNNKQLDDYIINLT